MIFDYANNLSDKLEKIHIFARKKLQLSSDNMKKKYDIGSKMQNIVEASYNWAKSLCFHVLMTYRPTSINRHIRPNLFDFL
jgi:hypothetical protein